ncbi:MAG: hypothetical protein BRC29_01880 [Nanohaloarchaea archaeon SW_7_43_1]|nr:MAG: hypothetical protein BRC29_01880 [Nanohaloarchaea archaeon SW_7_43_1]
MIEQILLLAGFAAAITLAVLMALSSLKKNYRFWPPSERNFCWLAYWILAGINVSSLVLLMNLNFPLLEFNLQILAGLLTGTIGTLITFAAILKLGANTTSGLTDELIDSGLYSISRNPQVMGNLLMLVGLTVLLPRPEIILLAIITAVWLFLMVFTEEKWLEEKYGENYRNYKSDVPRFINISKMESLLKKK